MGDTRTEADRRSAQPEGGTRARTRRAILDAAVTVLSTDPGASLSDVAAAAGVGRTTVHRYFPERSDLLAAMGRDVLDRIAEATDRARLDDGPAPKALERLCQEFFELGDRLMLAFEMPQLMDWSGWDECTPADLALRGLIERGHAEGTIDPEMDVEWIPNLLWGLLYTAWQHAREHKMPRHAALTLCLRTLRKSIAP
ncbi:TetR/AcrR family transcriptional regulator [Actinomadura sp. NPDC047616]|uniref:TetR/AcrR family transcriptional regulator n=1 Tax=Actinomadura sp. NPDC047616 TaxID=3155914 RepID=UPI0033E4F604